MGLKKLFGFLAPLIICFTAGQPVIAADKEPSPVYVIERDTLQTRNFTPIVNHQTMVVNLSDKPLTVALTSVFPTRLHLKGNGYPAFLDDSLLSDPLFSPLEVVSKKTTYLPQPQIITQGENVSYSWNKLPLPPGESMVAQYDNYFGEHDYYWRKDGFELHGISVKSDYTIKPQKHGVIELGLRFDITNHSADAIQDFNLGVFVPVHRLLKEKNIKILKLEKICTSANIEASRLTKADGYGEAAEGVGASISIKDLQPGDTEKFYLYLSGGQTAEDVTSWPILTITGRSIRPPIWPATTVTTDSPANQGRFSYLSYNLVIKDRLRFRLSPIGSVVENAK